MSYKLINPPLFEAVQFSAVSTGVLYDLQTLYGNRLSLNAVGAPTIKIPVGLVVVDMGIGDWLVKDAAGNFTVLSDADFTATYELDYSAA